MLSLFGTVTAFRNQHNQLFEQLGIANQKVFQNGQQVRDDIFDTWDESQLRQWLESHQIDVPAKYDQAKAVAQKHKDLLAEDIRIWLDEVGETANPLLSKSKEQLLQAKDAVFVQTAQTWSDSRLREFLEARGVFDYADATRDQLLDAVTKYRDWAVNYNSLGSWSFDSFNSEDIKEWFKEKGRQVEGTRQNLIKSAQEYAQQAADQVKTKGTDATAATRDAWNRQKEAAFKTWSESDLRDYLQSFGQKVDTITDRNKLVDLATQNYNAFMYGDQRSYAQKLGDHVSNWGTSLYGYLNWYGGALYERIVGIFGGSGRADLQV